MDGIFNSDTPSFVPETDTLGIGQIEKENLGLGGISEGAVTEHPLAGAMALELPEKTTPYYIEEGQADLLFNGQNEGAENGHFLLGGSGYLDVDSGGDLLTGQTEEMSQKEGEDLLTGGSLAIDKMVDEAQLKVRELLKGFAEKPEFEVEMGLAFGNSYDKGKAEVLKAGFSGEYLEVLPEIEIVNRDLINGANGAFAGETETIYLAREFVWENLGDVGAIAPVIIEEFGHYIDGAINSIDAPGDEGEIFASFVLGEELSLPEFWGMKVEDDGAIGFLDGRMVSIEQANVSWLGGRGDWYNPRKWSGGKVPKSSDNVTVEAVGERIKINFSKGNPNIRDLFLAAKDGGSLTLNGLTNVGNDTDILAEGKKSVVKLPDLKTFSGKDVSQPSSITVKDGGKIEAKKLATMKEVDLFADNGSLTLPGVKKFSGRSDTVIKATNEGKLSLTAKTISGDVDITATGEGSVVQLPRLTAFNGTDVSQPSFLFAENDGTIQANKLKTLKEVDLYADNSKLSLSGANNFSGRSDTVIKATNEGKLSLSAKTISGDVDITATGEGSVVQLPRLTAFNGTDVSQPSFLFAENDGTIQVNKLKTLKEVDLYADNSKLSLSGANNFSGRSDTVIKATNEGKLSLTAKTISGDVDITATGEGSVVQLPRLTAFNGTDVSQPSFLFAENDGTIQANKLKTLKEVDLYADNSKLSLSGANNFSGRSDTVIKATNEGKLSLTAKTISGDVDITATGEGSVVQLPRLTAFNGTDVSQPSFLFAENDGTIQANKLKTLKEVDLYADNSKLSLSGANNFSGRSDTVIKATNEGKLSLSAKTISGDVDITATGEGSVVQLPRLTAFNGTDVSQPSFLFAENDGTIQVNKLKTLKEVDLYADNSKLNLSGANNFSGRSDTVIKATNEGKLSLSAKTISGDVDITATGEGSVVNLPKLTRFLGKDVYQPSFVMAEDGGKVKANKLKTVTNVDPLVTG